LRPLICCALFFRTCGTRSRLGEGGAGLRIGDPLSLPPQKVPINKPVPLAVIPKYAVKRHQKGNQPSS
jgi:hypothetical protein